MNNKIWFLYFGRLDQEKWWDSIIQVIENFGKKDKKLPFSIFVFGEWEYQDKVTELASKYEWVHYFWWQSLDTIKRYLDNCHYLLMTSTFLETFGLTALNALSWWLPVVGYAKGGLLPFIIDEYDITKAKWKDNTERLYNLIQDIIKNHSEEKYKLYQKTTKVISSKYSIKEREKNTKNILPKDTKRILLVTDFKAKLGGIETYIWNTKEILEEMWYEVEIWGKNFGRKRIVKYFGMILSMFNIWAYWGIKKSIKKFNPDVVRYHSTLRRMWRMGVLASKNFKGQKMVMYHDFGYLYPFPRQLTDTKQIKYPLNLRTFLNSYPTKNILKKLFIIGKYITLNLLKKCLSKHIDKHLVPAKYMVDILKKSYKLSADKVIELPHFIQK